MTRPYLRFPHIVGDRIAFTADDDVWITRPDGGPATRLTADRAPVSRPRLSPDGRHVAWVSHRDGSPEVYLTPVDGGDPRRLTYWADRATRMLTWLDDRPVAATPSGSPHRSHTWAYALPLDGGQARRLPYGPTAGLVIGGDGSPTVLQSSIFREPATWKRYRGGTAAKLWIDRTGTGEFARLLPELDGQLSDPCLLAGRVLFCSDHEGYANVYSVDVDGSDLRRHTDHSDADGPMWARNLTADGTHAVYQRGGDLWLLDSVAADSQARRLDVVLPGSRTGRLPQRPAVADAIVDLDVDHTGRASVIGARGTVQWLTHRDGPVRALADTAGVRTRLPRVVGRDGAAVWVTDADGDDALDLRAADGSMRRLAGGRIGRVLELAVTPSGTTAALATHDGRVLLVDLSTGEVRELEKNPAGDASRLAFSPDSQWLAWSAAAPYGLSGIRLARVSDTDRDTAPISVGPTRFVDTEPCFTPDGRYLAFLSARTFDPVYDVHSFDLGFPVGVRPYLVPLRADVPSPFDPDPAGRALSGGEGGEGGDGLGTDDATSGSASAHGAAARDGTPTVQVDADGLGDRVVPVPVPPARYRELSCAHSGLLWLEAPVTGVLGVDRGADDDEPKAALRRFDFAKGEVVDLVDRLDGYVLSGDGRRIVTVCDGELRVGPADRKVEDPAPGEVVTVDLGRTRLVVDPAAEWRQMTVETWRLMRDHFWVDDLAGVDWDGVLAAYLPVVDRIATRDELSELLWEMIGELGTSHAYERQAPWPTPTGAAAAFLGADLSVGPDGRWRVDRLPVAESSVPAARSPLRSGGVDVRAGDVLLAVDGRAIGPAGPAPLLAGLADKPVHLSVERDGVRLEFAVVPLESETPLRYHDWVAGRRARVHELTDGRVGYVHIPDMMSEGWSEFHRDLRAETGREALVVDTRENGGGHTSQLVIERLARRVIGYSVARHHEAETWPFASPRGPLVSLANEQAGSDGDIVNVAFREYGLGPIIGTRTWGGIVGIDSRYDLVDGTAVTQPRYAHFFTGTGWDVENHGVDPDIEVPMPPQAWAAGEDPQLDEGVRQVLALLTERPPLSPPDPRTRPPKSPGPLPARP